MYGEPRDYLTYESDGSGFICNNATSIISNNPEFFYDSRRAGGGKTYDIVAAACRKAERGHKCLIVQPTTLLIDETFGDLKTRFPSVTAYRFHSDDGQVGNVSSR